MESTDEEKLLDADTPGNVIDPEKNNDVISSNGDKQMRSSVEEMCTVEERKTKTEVFKKPSFLIGPRKGKPIGKMQVLKSAEPPDTVIETEEPPKEDQSVEIKNTADVAIKSESDKDVVEKKVHVISPAQKLNENSVPLPYKEPKWSGIPNDLYKFEVLKNGSIVETIDLSSKPYFVFGRLTQCDIQMAHPTVSRYHAVLQFRSDDTDGAVGFYVYDLGSTHGTFLNKNRIKPNIYVRVHVGHLLKLGGSSRMFILQGPEEDMEKESELSVTELKEKRKEEQAAKELQEIQESEELRLQQEKEAAAGIDWGMGDDAEEETDLSENPFAAAPNEELYLDDPKKTLRGWFEREGYDLEYDVEERGFGQFLCRVELPVESVKGGTIIAESLVKGKKKEAVVQCALEACRILDRYGLLRQAKHESRKRKVKNWEENDFYDSDEDEFLDRTGSVEKKRQQRMKAAGKIQTQTETYESLVEKQEEILSQIDKIQNQLEEIQTKKKKEPEADEDEDELDAFMTNLSAEVPDHKLINKLKSELLMLRKEEAHVKKLVNIACPASLPKLMEESTPHSSLQYRNKYSGVLKRKIPCHSSEVEVPQVKDDIFGKEAEDEEEEEEEEEEDDDKSVRMEISKNPVDAAEKPEKEAAVKDINEERSKVIEELIQEKNSSQKDIVNDSSDSQGAKERSNKCNETNASKSPKVIGPILPPEDFVTEGHTEKRKKRARHRPNKKIVKESVSMSSADPNYSMWLPPEDQSGDGKTKLNEKYGY
ncbi:hypothetical protein R5R35_005383 [Gryllus longicercus]|uniref:FHA domain-containing protein n=1 Tax=Gryllus longicercus TaxID=2509291 RepID=A0AAN9V892_9ORTH